MSLSPIDRKIKKLYENENTDEEIANAVDLHQRTVRRHLAKMRKSGVIGYREELVQKHSNVKPQVVEKTDEVISKTELLKLLEIHESRAGVARALDISSKTISRLCHEYQIIDNKRRSELLNKALKRMLSNVEPYEIKDKSTSKGDTLVIHITDCHAGKIIINQNGETIFNQDIFRLRFDKFITQILKLLDKNIKKGVNITDVAIVLTGDNANGENIYSTQAYEQEFAPPKQVMLVVESICKLVTSLRKRDLEVSMYGVKGNHGRCHSKDTKLLTTKGYKNYWELNEGDLIPTWNQDKNKLEIKPIQDIHIYEEEKMINFKNKTSDISVTHDHDMLVYNPKKNIYNKRKANDIKDRWANIFPTFTNSNQEDYPISDNELRLLGWILTDGVIHKNHNITTIYQSKEENIKEIRKLLNSLNLDYREIKRKRKKTHVCGTLLLKEPKTAHEFKIWSKDSKKIKSLIPNKKIQPWMYKLSDRQMKIFKDTVIKGDGSIKPSHTTIIKEQKCNRKKEEVIYGEEEFLQDLQGLFVTHGINCSLNSNCRDDYYLQIRKSKHQYVYKKDVEEQIYKDKVWCVTVDNHTIFTEKNGKPVISGNSGRDADPAANWDLMIYEILKWRYDILVPDEGVSVYFAETDYMTIEIRGHNYLLRHKAYEQPDTAAGRVKFNAWSRQHDVEAICYGHYHHFGLFDCDNVRVFRGGSIPGGDGFSEGMAKDSDPALTVWGVNDKRVMTFFYAIDLMD